MIYPKDLKRDIDKYIKDNGAENLVIAEAAMKKAFEDVDNYLNRRYAEEDRLKKLSEDSRPLLKFNLVIGDIHVAGKDVPFSNFVVGDLTDRAQATEDFLTRLLGMPVKIETGEE